MLLFNEYKQREMTPGGTASLPLLFARIAGLIGGVIDQFVDIETFLVIGEGIITDMKWVGLFF